LRGLREQQVSRGFRGSKVCRAFLDHPDLQVYKVFKVYKAYREFREILEQLDRLGHRVFKESREI
jgi:hypothetical protein